MHVVQAPDPKLRVKTKLIKKITPELLRQTAQMIKLTKTFVDPEGVGLASTQVGEDGAYFVGMKKDNQFQVYFNPEIIKHSKTEKVLTAAERKSLSEVVPEVQLEKAKVCFFGKGCEECNGTGFRGRVGIHEVLVPDAAMREAVLSKAPASELKRLAIAGGMVPMIEDGFAKVQAGLTTIEEVLRMLYE
jgi:peptide deformylase